MASTHWRSASAAARVARRVGLPMAVGRFLADHRRTSSGPRDPRARPAGFRYRPRCWRARAVRGRRTGGRATDIRSLEWPLRWAALAVPGQALFAFLTSVSTSVRQSRVGLWMAVSRERGLKRLRARSSSGRRRRGGSNAGKAIGYAVGSAGGLYLTLRLLGRPRRRVAAPRRGESPEIC